MTGPAVEALPARVAYKAAAGETIVTALVKLGAPADAPRLPALVELLVEHGPAMHADRRVELAQLAGRTIVEALAPEDWLGVAVYGERGKLVLPAEPVGDGTKARRTLGFLDTHALGHGAAFGAGLGVVAPDLRAHAGLGFARKVVVIAASPQTQAGLAGDKEAVRLASRLAEEGVGFSALGLGTDWPVGLLSRLVEAGRGGVWHLPRPADVLPAARREAAGLRALALADVRLGLRFAKGVQPRRIVQVLPTIGGLLPERPSEREASVRVGELSADQPRYLLVELVVPDPEEGTFRLATLHASGTGPDGRVAKSEGTELVVSFAPEPSPLLPEVRQHMDDLQVFLLVERALGARQEQQPAKMHELVTRASRIVPADGGGLAGALGQAVTALDGGQPLTETLAKALYAAARRPAN